MKKLLVVGIIILLVGMNIPSTGIDVEKFTVSYDGNILYVGGSGPGNYTKIQDAIDDATNSDTVYVYDGTYIEILTIDKSINLIGEDRNHTIIDGDNKGDVISVEADSVTISGFTIKNCRAPGNPYDFVVVRIADIDHVTIKNNMISLGYFYYNNEAASVYLKDASYCTIQNNIIKNIEGEDQSRGIKLDDNSTYNNISGNVISDYSRGVDIQSYDYPDSHHNNIVYNNHIHDNGYGIYISSSNNNKILYNVVSSNSDTGMDLSYANDFTVIGNVITNNGGGYDFEGGIVISTIDTAILSDNIISHNDPVGFYTIGFRNYDLKNNHISENVQIGIYSNFDEYCNISRNNIVRNGNYNAVFESTIINCSTVKWSENYWRLSLGILPHRIIGVVYLLNIFLFRVPWFNFDWNPAKAPYDI